MVPVLSLLLWWVWAPAGQRRTWQHCCPHRHHAESVAALMQMEVALLQLLMQLALLILELALL